MVEANFNQCVTEKKKSASMQNHASLHTAPSVLLN